MYSIFVRISLSVIASIFLSACGDPNTRVSQFQFADNDALYTSGAIRLVTERPRAIPGGGFLPTLCSEPSPDVAIAFAKSAAAAANFSEPQGPTVSGNVNFNSSETATGLAGRTAGVLALRDGLYAACQTYVNGVIGHDAYALILSQYGNLLVALNGTGTVNQATFTAQDSATSALLVACLSEHDPSRLAGVDKLGRPLTNPLLTLNFCDKLLAQIARGSLVHVAAAVPAKKVAVPKPTLTTPSAATEKPAPAATDKPGPATADKPAPGPKEKPVPGTKD
jgi:hypothetical protein